MLDAVLEHPFFLNRHRQAPLLKERESAPWRSRIPSGIMSVIALVTTTDFTGP
jgi:hypothetical protein